MANRYCDWLKQAEADLRHARNALADGDYEWSCFAAQQAGEKALKALYLKLGMEAWGRTVAILLGKLSQNRQVPQELADCAKMLDKHYILTRYPNGFDSGAPTDFYTRGEAQTAVECAEKLVGFCRDQIGE
ncbi:MAG: HEPN domain-containing protein [Armatimonadota bacterium]